MQQAAAYEHCPTKDNEEEIRLNYRANRACHNEQSTRLCPSSALLQYKIHVHSESDTDQGCYPSFLLRNVSDYLINNLNIVSNATFMGARLSGNDIN